MAKENIHNPIKEAEEQKSVSSMFSTIKFTFSLYWDLAPFVLILNIVSRVITEIEGLVYAYIFAYVIDSVIEIISSGTQDYFLIFRALLILVAYSLISKTAYTLRSYSNGYLRNIQRGNIELKMFEQLERVGMVKLEDPEIANSIRRAKDWLFNTYDLLDLCVGFITYVFVMVLAGYTIVQFNFWLALILISVSLIKFLPNRYFRKLSFEWWVDRGNSESRRKSWQDYGDLSQPERLGELYITGGTKYFKKRWKDFYDYFLDRLLDLNRNRSIVDWFLGLFETVVTIGAYFMVFRDAILGLISIGDILFYLRAIEIFLSRSNQVFMNMSSIWDYSNKVSASKKIFDLPDMKDGTIKLERLKEPPGIEINGLWFKYPRAKRYIFKKFDLKIEPGEKIAIVGANGAGKTTLVKVIARQYDYQKGSIKINDNELKDLKINDWYKNIGILFQEYNFHTQLNAEENIYVGKPTKPKNKKALIAASKAADAHNFIMKYPEKYKQVLSERYDDGIRPSTGQKQKIAIARFIYRNAPLAIFDEPTAAIDAESEYKIFNNIYEFFNGKTVILISHRFSTVRNADRIIVLDNGNIVEQGSHKQLMKADGKYAKAFKLQAEGYR